jgi:epoxide hydrolase 4
MAEPIHKFEEHRISVNGIKLHAVSCGEGPLVILLHGFPEYWGSWKHQLKALAAAGFQAVAPDMRGYNLSDKPKRVADYDLPILVSDVVALGKAFGSERFHLLGHDWGGAVAWYCGLIAPESLHSLTIMNAPHPRAFEREIFTAAQVLKSWYMFYFQVPFLPEFLSGVFPKFVLKSMTDALVNKDAFSKEDLDGFFKAQNQPGAWRSMIHYYRSAFRSECRRAVTYLVKKEKGHEDTLIKTPTLIIWGEQDRFLGNHLLNDLEQWVPNLKIVRIPESGHWVQNEAPEKVNKSLLEFLDH